MFSVVCLLMFILLCLLLFVYLVFLFMCSLLCVCKNNILTVPTYMSSYTSLSSLPCCMCYRVLSHQGSVCTGAPWITGEWF